MTNLLLVGLGTPKIENDRMVCELGPLPPETIFDTIQIIVCQCIRFIHALFTGASTTPFWTIIQADNSLRNPVLTSNRLIEARLDIMNAVRELSSLPFTKSTTAMSTALRVTEWLYNAPNDAHRSNGAIARDLFGMRCEEHWEALAQHLFTSLTGSPVTLGAVSDEALELLKVRIERMDIITKEIRTTARNELSSIAAAFGCTELPLLSKRFTIELNALTRDLFEFLDTLQLSPIGLE